MAKNDSEFKVERGVPVPPGVNSAYSKYPFADMKVGDSFLVSQVADSNRVRSAACYYAIRHPGFKFTIKQEAGGGLRVWRIPATKK